MNLNSKIENSQQLKRFSKNVSLDKLKFIRDIEIDGYLYSQKLINERNKKLFLYSGLITKINRNTDNTIEI